MNRHEAFRCRPLLLERIWGGDSLQSLFHRKGDAEGGLYGESWELSDRPEADSMIAEGEFQGMSLHQLWEGKRDEVFGEGYGHIERFPVLCKILDARESLSIQVHPPCGVAARRDAEQKSELWYVAGRADDAVMYLGLKPGVNADDVRKAVEETRLEGLLREFRLGEDESIFLPSGMTHGLGGGYLIFEIQQNSDTTYRLYDWGRVDNAGNPRELHLEEAMECIEEFDGDSDPRPSGDGVLLNSQGFLIEECTLNKGELVPHRAPSRFMICTVAKGSLKWSNHEAKPGDFIIVPANAPELFAGSPETKVLLTSISM